MTTKPYFPNLKSKWIILSKKEKFAFSFFISIFLVLLVYALFWTNPRDFRANSLVRIESGTSLSESAIILERENIIKSKFWFKVISILSKNSRNIKAGDYFFGKPQSVFTVAKRLHNGDFSINQVKITIPEGMNIIQIADLMAEKFALFNQEEFINKAEEGYLFPDTYFFLRNVSADQVISVMKPNFNSKIKKIESQIESSEKNLVDIIKIASILEEEATSTEDRKNISTILWRRISIGMPLQVDATFSYVNGKNTYELTKEDLSIDSPYNLYKNTGLPPTAISNPGIDAIEAAINPTENNFLYFLSDTKGNVYYAEDFEGHQTNRELYLRK